MTHLTKVALLESMKRALGGAYFNICGVEHAAKVLGQPYYTGSHDWQTLQALHCVQWSSFDAQAKLETCQAVARVLGIEASTDNVVFLAQTALLIPSEV